jgi:hypothetical protein
MTTTKASLTRLADALRSAAPTLDADEQELVVGLYRSLARGAPVGPAALAADLGVTQELIEDVLDRWPGVYRSEQGEVIGIWGLALTGMPHHMDIGDASVTAWCALDPFLITALLATGETRVRSQDPVTGESITLTIGGEGVLDVSPPTAVVSMLEPDGSFDHQVVETFCHNVWFFASPKSGEAWTNDHTGTFLLTVREADTVARMPGPLSWATCSTATTRRTQSHDRYNPTRSSLR